MVTWKNYDVANNQLSYNFYAVGKVESIVYPSGRKVIYKYDLAGNVNAVDIAFLPVTGCPGRWKKENIIKGFFYSIDNLNPEVVFPMLAFHHEYLLKEFAELATKRNVNSKIICVENKGDNYLIEDQSTASK